MRIPAYSWFVPFLLRVNDRFKRFSTVIPLTWGVTRGTDTPGCREVLSVSETKSEFNWALGTSSQTFVR